MAVARLGIRAERASAFRDLQRRLRKAGETELRKKLRDEITKAGRPVLTEVRTVVRNLPVTGVGGGGSGARRAHNIGRARNDAGRTRAERKGAGLRETVAAATRLQITTNGVRFTVNGSKMPADQANLPRYLDSEKGWRHPVFGNRETWVAQRGQPWFAVTILKRAPKFRAAVLDAMTAVQKELES